MKLTKAECKCFLMKIGIACLDDFLLWIAQARKGGKNVHQVDYKGSAGFLEIDRESAKLLVERVNLDEIKNIPLEIPDGIKKGNPLKSSFTKNGLLISFEITDPNKASPCAIFRVEEI